MFTLPTELGDRIEQALAARVCTATDGSYIHRSSGRRKPLSKNKYIVHMADGNCFKVFAWNDEQAVQLANHRTEKRASPPTKPVPRAID